MTDSAFPPAPVSRMRPGETIIVSKCLKCGNEIKLAIGSMTREQVERAVDAMDGNSGECPGGYHVELSGWRRMWDLDRAISEHFAAREAQGNE